ncbi:hypothetical protein V5799_006863 [Amblyomma americanum]|uniref:VWFA domain-containing protein n=1 Tax=Amblyomma americanum TaxID=6943 RepID=A0AAQ4DV65_AMBAM
MQVKLNSCSARMRFTATLPNGANCSIKKDCQFTDDCKIDVFQPSDTLVESSIMFMPYLANNEGRLDFLKEATSRYIRDIPEGSLRLAIVTFSGTANIAYNLTTVNSASREGFLNVVKRLKHISWTCIGCGLQLALQIRTFIEMTAHTAATSQGSRDREDTLSCATSRAKTRHDFRTLRVALEAHSPQWYTALLTVSLVTRTVQRFRD